MKQCAAWATAWWERCANRLLKEIYAREILQSQKRFIADVAHELRTPLSTIKTSSEVALIDTGLPKDARESFEEILGELERVSEILNNLLSLNSLARPEEMLFKSLDMLAIADAVLERLRPIAREKKIRLRLRGEPDSIAWANATAVEQIMTNVIKNAISYTPSDRDGRVEVVVRPAEDAAVLFEVSDTGLGMRPEDLAHVFEPFYRADPSRTKLINKKTGSGLGLTIANELIRAQGGTIHMESRYHKGTTVRIRLPAGGWRKVAASPSVQHPSAILGAKQETTAIWSPIRAAVTFLRGK